MCTFVPPPDGITSAQISWYPGNPGSMSGLEVGCVFRNDTGNSMISPSFTVHDSETVSYHNGAAKPVRNAAIVASGATSITLSTSNNGVVGLPNGVLNRIISGPGIGPRTVVTSFNTGSNVATLNRPTVASIPALSNLKIENSIGRSVTDATRTAPDLLNSTQANFSAADVGLSVSGTGIPVNTTIAAITIAGSQAQLNNSFASVQPTVSIGGSDLVSTVRQVTGVTTTSTVRLRSDTGLASFVASDVGLPVTGGCNQLTSSTGDDTLLPANLVITATPSQANADTTGGLVSGWSGCTIVIGQPNANAAAEGDIVASQGVQLNLNPSLVPGADECANEQPEGFALTGLWYNPGTFQGAGATNAQPGPTPANPAALATKAVGQIFFDTSAADFSAFVIERKNFTSGDPNGNVHYDVVFPFAPTGLALCPSTADSPGLSFLLDVEGTTNSQSTLATGTGRPGTGQIRNIQASATGGFTTKITVDSQGATAFTPQSSFERLCVYPTGFPNPINFQCGAG